MKKFSVLLALVGLALGTLLIGWFGAGGVFGAAFALGWVGFFWLVLCQLGILAWLGFAWRMLLRTGSPLTYVWGRMVRDSAGNLLPFSQMGGFIFGARAITLHGVSARRAVASTLVDVAIEFLAQMAFAGVGLVILILRVPNSALVWPLAIGLALAVIGGAAFIALQQGVGAIFRALTERISAGWLRRQTARIGALEGELSGIYQRVPRLALAGSVHFIGWIYAGLTTWLALHLLGSAIDVASAIALEAILQAGLNFAVLVPGYLGVQEAALAAIGALFGVAPEVTLAFSLIRRARDIAIGVPVLLLWQAFEARRVRETLLS